MKKMRANLGSAETELPIHDLMEAGAFKGEKNGPKPLETGEGVDQRADDGA